MQNEQLALSGIPLLDPLKKGSTDFFLSKYYIDLLAGQRIVISGEVENLPSVVRSEIHVIQEVYLQDYLSRVYLERPLENTFIRNSVRVNANVALASHGETLREILGNGNAAATFQKFILKHNPLTYTSSSAPGGIQSSLEIRVNDILWTEVSSLYGLDHNQHIFITRRNSEGQTTIIFGDGITGSRLPTGNQNIVAVYRRGIGQAGMLDANQLTQLVSRPLHLKAVNNPLKPEGAQDGERMANARSNANLTMYTLDRVVSLQDYEDFARAFAGIKSQRPFGYGQIKERRFISLLLALMELK